MQSSFSPVVRYPAKTSSDSISVLVIWFPGFHRGVFFIIEGMLIGSPEMYIFLISSMVSIPASEKVYAITDDSAVSFQSHFGLVS